MPEGYQFVDPADEAWLAEQLAKPPSAFDSDGVCFVTWKGEILGPYRCKAEAYTAHPLATNADLHIVFGDPLYYHVPESERPNG